MADKVINDIELDNLGFKRHGNCFKKDNFVIYCIPDFPIDMYDVYVYLENEDEEIYYDSVFYLNELKELLSKYQNLQNLI